MIGRKRRLKRATIRAPHVSVASMINSSHYSVPDTSRIPHGGSRSCLRSLDWIWLAASRPAEENQWMTFGGTTVLKPICLGHPFSSFERVLVDGTEKIALRPDLDERGKMERALYIIELNLQSEVTARKKGVASFIDRWAIRFMLCENRQLRARFSKALTRAYGYRHLKTN